MQWEVSLQNPHSKKALTPMRECLFQKVTDLKDTRTY